MYEYDDLHDFMGPEDLGYVHEDSLPNRDEVKDYLIGLQEALYDDGSVSKLEHCIEELCFLFDCEFNRKDEYKLVNKEDGRLMNYYLGYQRAYIDNIKNNQEVI